jgi:hypothetical protein
MLDEAVVNRDAMGDAPGPRDVVSNAQSENERDRIIDGCPMNPEPRGRS